MATRPCPCDLRRAIAAHATGFLRKDAPVAEEEFTVFQNAITANEARPVLISNAAPAA